MELIPVLKLLWRKRVLVGIALLFSVAVGVVVAFRVSLLPPELHSRQHNVGVASANILIDSPKSSLADLSPLGAGALDATADLLASVLATQGLEDQIATQAGIPFDRLLVALPSSGLPIPTALGTTAQASGSTAAKYKLVVTTDDPQPIISLAATAPDPQSAARLANGAIQALRQYLNSVAVREQIPARRRPVITRLGSPVVGLAFVGPRRLYGVAATVLLFALAIAAIVTASGIARAWRLAEAREARKTESSDDDHDGRKLARLSPGVASANGSLLAHSELVRTADSEGAG